MKDTTKHRLEGFGAAVVTAAILYLARRPAVEAPRSMGPEPRPQLPRGQYQPHREHHRGGHGHGHHHHRDREGS